MSLDLENEDTGAEISLDFEDEDTGAKLSLDLEAEYTKSLQNVGNQQSWGGVVTGLQVESSRVSIPVGIFLFSKISIQALGFNQSQG